MELELIEEKSSECSANSVSTTVAASPLISIVAIIGVAVAISLVVWYMKEKGEKPVEKPVETAKNDVSSSISTLEQNGGKTPSQSIV